MWTLEYNNQKYKKNIQRAINFAKCNNIPPAMLGIFHVEHAQSVQYSPLNIKEKIPLLFNELQGLCCFQNI